MTKPYFTIYMLRVMCHWLTFSHRQHRQHPDVDFSCEKNNLSSMQMSSDSPSNGKAPPRYGVPYAPLARAFFGIAWRKCCTRGQWSSNGHILYAPLVSFVSYILCHNLDKHVSACRDGAGDGFVGFRCSCT